MDAATALLSAQVTTATALATVGLVYFTWMLAERSAQPHIVATVELSPWSMLHVDLVVANTGNAAAYDIHVAFDPPLKTERMEGKGTEMPFSSLT